MGDERPGFDANKKINKESSGISQMDYEMPTIMIQTELRLKWLSLGDLLKSHTFHVKLRVKSALNLVQKIIILLMIIVYLEKKWEFDKI